MKNLNNVIKNTFLPSFLLVELSKIEIDIGFLSFIIGSVHMTTFYIVGGIVTAIAALIGTLLVGKDISSKIKQYEDEGDSLENELARSHEYETKSLKVNIKSLTWIYVGLALAVIIVSLAILIY